MLRGFTISMLSLLVIGNLTVSCSSKEMKEREPAQAADNQTQLLSDIKESNSPEHILNLVNEMGADFPKNKMPVEVLIRSTIEMASISQKLAASFDVRLEQQLRHQTEESPHALRQDLDCRIWENYVSAHESEETLLALQEDILAIDRPDIYRWFVSLFFATHNDNAATIMAKAQLSRSLASNHAEVCHTISCPSFPKVTNPKQRPFDPFSDREMLNYKNQKLNEIAIYTVNDLDSKIPGYCFEQSQREPSQEAAFDWKTHHTSGYSLKPGEFVVTYDDGPHAKYTPALIKLWTDAGYTKPSFFWLQINLRRNVPLAQSIRAQGYTIGSHSFDHPDFGNLAKATKASELNGANRGLFAKDLSTSTLPWEQWKAATLEKEIITSTEYIYKTLDLDSTVANGEHLFRLPYGSGVKNPLIGTYFSRLNVRHYFWTIDSLDWQDKNPLSILQRIQKQMQITKRGIILIHDIHPQSVQATALMLQAVKDNKMPVPVQFVPLPRSW